MADMAMAVAAMDTAIITVRSDLMSFSSAILQPILPTEHVSNTSDGSRLLRAHAPDTRPPLWMLSFILMIVVETPPCPCQKSSAASHCIPGDRGTSFFQNFDSPQAASSPVRLTVGDRDVKMAL